MDSPQISVVAPVFNEEHSIGELVERVRAACSRLQAPFEILIVNDGSRDQTLVRLIQLSKNLPQLRVVNLSRNFGHMPALSAGVALARGAAVVTMDGDLQDPPELIQELVARWRQGADVVFAVREGRGESFPRKLLTRLFYNLLDKITETDMPAQVGTYGLMDRRVADVLNRLPERQRYFAGLRAWAGSKTASVPYNRPKRPHGKSRVGWGGLFGLARTALTSFSKAPLRYASAFSLICGFILFLVGAAAIGIRLWTNLAIPGWATFTALIGMMGFAQSLVLAILAEYVAVLFDEVKARPLFLVREEFVQGEPVRLREAEVLG